MKTPKNAHLWERHPDDWYVEETSATEDLLRVESFPGWSHDPCCGRGHIVTTMQAAGNTVTGSDIEDRAGSPAWFLGRSDFTGDTRKGLECLALYGADNCVMNPPFFKGAGSEQFIRSALAWAPGKVAAFLPLKFLGSAGRSRGFWKECPPNRIWILGHRPSCPPGPVIEAGEEPGGGFEDFMWAVWDRQRFVGGSGRLPISGRPLMGWIVRDRP